MSLNLGFYLILIGFGIIYSFYPHANKNIKIHNCVIFFILLLYSVASRFSGFERDMEVYARVLEKQPQSMLTNLYYTREWAYWLTSSWLYQIIQNKELVFIVLDSLSFIFILKARDNLNLPYSYVLTFFVFFPSVLGLNNAYRQYLASTVLVYSLTSKRNSSKYISFFLSIFLHNSAALFLPLTFLDITNPNTLRKYKNIQRIILIFTSFLILAVLPSAADTKSSASTGSGDYGLIYILSLVFIFLWVVISSNLRISGIHIQWLWHSSYLIYIVLVSSMFLAAAQAERIGMMSFQIILFQIFRVVEHRYKQKSFMKVVIILILALPTFLFPNVYGFLE